MKKILFIIGALFGGGAEKALIEMLKAFDYTRYQVTLCIVYHEGIYLPQIPPQVKVVYIWSGKKGFLSESSKRKAFRQYRKRGATWIFRTILYYRLRERHFDAIVSYVEGLPLLFHSFITHRSPRNISWVHCDLRKHHWTTETFPDLALEEPCYQKMDELVFVSDGVRRSFEQMYPLKHIPKRCIYNLIDVPHIRALAHSKEVEKKRFTVIAIGSLIKVKAFDRLIQVARMFKDAHYEIDFQILGIGEDEPLLRQQCKELGVEDSVHFLGFQSPPYPYLAAADVLMSTSRSEALPLVICEALALGVPIVATKTIGAVELLANGKYGLLVDHDVDSIFEGLKRMIDDESLRKEFQDKSKERIEIFGKDHTMNQIYQLLEGK